MSLFGDMFGDQQQAGRDIAKGYKDAQNYMDPYYQGGKQAYGQYTGDLNNIRGQLNQYGNPADWMYSQINQNPADFYQTLMKGYNETPQAQYEQEQMMRAANQGASASGMAGSGQFFKDLQQNAADITSRDQDRYLNNIMGVNNQQMGYLNDYRGLQNQYMNGMNGLSQMGQQAAGQQGQYAIGQGYGNAQASAASSPWANAAGQAAGTVSAFF